MPKPRYWFLLDNLVNPAFGDIGQAALEAPEVEKVTLIIREPEAKDLPNMTYWAPPRGARYMKKGSITFAMAWLVLHGYTRLIFAGCDMSTGYCHKETTPEKDIQMRRFHGKLLPAMQQIVEENPRVEFISISPGPINQFMEQP